MKLYQEIPADRKALVWGLFGGEKEMVGPARVPRWKSVRMFYHRVINDGERGMLFDQEGNHKEVIGPSVIDVHPDGEYEESEQLLLSETEAVVIIRRDGTRDIIQGDETPEVYVSTFEELYRFIWTGRTEEKEPGGLMFDKLQLQDTQSYYAFPVRTKDNSVITLRLMIYWRVGDIEKIVQKSSDPLGAMFNKIKAEITATTADINFDDFKDDAMNLIREHDLFKGNGLAFFEGYGIEIQQVVLREWSPVDPRVQQVLEQAAVVQTKKSLDTAEHELNMQRLDHQEVELEKEATLDDLKRNAAEEDGIRQGTELKSLHQALKEEVGEDTAKQLLKLSIAKDARELNIGSDLLK